MMIWSPTLFPRGQRLATMGGHVDVNPTILDLMGLPAPASWEGRSLFAPQRSPRVYFYAAADDYLLGLREGNFKYIYNVTRGRDELYDLTQDPDEHVNLASTRREACAVWRQRLAAWKHHAAGNLARAQAKLARIADNAPPASLTP
jgi:arylsulfatase A-like enzyme